MTENAKPKDEAPATDPRLDNRSGDQRPKVADEVKPQQVYGGQPGDEREFEDPPSGTPTSVYRSEGPHGRGPKAGPAHDED